MLPLFFCCIHMDELEILLEFSKTSSNHGIALQLVLQK